MNAIVTYEVKPSTEERENYRPEVTYAAVKVWTLRRVTTYAGMDASTSESVTVARFTSETEASLFAAFIADLIRRAPYATYNR